MEALADISSEAVRNEILIVSWSWKGDDVKICSHSSEVVRSFRRLTTHLQRTSCPQCLTYFLLQWFLSSMKWIETRASSDMHSQRRYWRLVISFANDLRALLLNRVLPYVKTIDSVPDGTAEPLKYCLWGRERIEWYLVRNKILNFPESEPSTHCFPVRSQRALDK